MARSGLPTSAMLQRQYQDLTRKLFTSALSKLFADCTGLRFDVSWSPPPPLAWKGVLPAACALCLKRLDSKREATAGCHGCLAEHFPLARQSGRQGHAFACPFGVANFWVPIHLQSVCLGIVCFQAQRKPGGGGRKPAGLPALGKSEFDRAARLLRLIAHDVVETARAEVLRQELQSARRAMREREKTETRLRQKLQQVLPAVRANAAKFATETHGQQIVRQMLDHIHQNYNRPVQLKECAEKIRRNAARLSALFSQTVGLPFKQYLTELRLQKAQELLNDPDRTIAEVAYSVGYTNPNRFRLAFKQWAGLPPSAWRGSPPAQRPGAS